MTNAAAQRLADRYISPDGSEPAEAKAVATQRAKDLRTVTEFIAWAEGSLHRSPSSQTALLAFSRLVGISREQLMKMARGEK